MSKVFTCDKCDNTAQAQMDMANPQGWMTITINGYVPRTDTRVGGSQTVKYDLCEICLAKVFPEDYKPMDVRAEFMEFAEELIRELVEEALDNAQR